jgi:hypothetical protein
MIKKKCYFNVCTGIKTVYYEQVKIIKKFYTYNFYSFENKCYGCIVVLIYMAFLFFNIMFTIKNIIENIIENNTSEPTIQTIVIHFIAFELNIFIEIYCSTFYLIINHFTQFFIAVICFAFLNVILFTTVFVKLYLLEGQSSGDFDEYPRRIAHIIYIFFFTFFFLLSYFKIKKYDVNGIKNFYKLF